MNLHKRNRKTNEMNALSKRISKNVERAQILQTTVALTGQQRFVIVDNLCTVKLFKKIFIKKWSDTGYLDFVRSKWSYISLHTNKTCSENKINSIRGRSSDGRALA